MSEYKIFILTIFVLSCDGLQHSLSTCVNKQYTQNLFRGFILLRHTPRDKSNNNIITIYVCDYRRDSEW
jgi:hypothetical protein